MKLGFLLVWLLLGASLSAKELTPTERFLREFHANPAAVMDRLPRKSGVSDAHLIRSRDPAAQWEERQRFRKMLRANTAGSPMAPRLFSDYLLNDRVEDLVDNSDTLLRDLNQISKAGLTKARLQVQPWSGDYWPFYRGVLGARVYDPYFMSQDQFANAQDYILKNPFLPIFLSGVAEKINQLSVSEKYDLLMGNQQGGFTQNQWWEGEQYKDANGHVETWMGICHGWAPAAFMEDRPERSVELLAADGKTRLQFRPSEIKGLSTHLWANTRFPTRFVGGRCNSKSPQKDENGRVIEPNCVDNNPATWHLAVVNQIGVSKRSFIIDATYDYQVWNQPVLSYSYTYFNPQTLEETPDLNKATIPIGEYSVDKFKKYRSPKAKKVVGVTMTVSYLLEEMANERDYDAAEFDAVRTVEYVYDLELDDRGLPIGGEWYSNAHPDFLWVPEPNATVIGMDEASLPVWNGDGALPVEWRRLGVYKGNRGALLGRLVELMIRKAQTP